jgi:hypothetical protein
MRREKKQPSLFVRALLFFSASSKNVFVDTVEGEEDSVGIMEEVNEGKDRGGKIDFFDSPSAPHS